MSILSKTWFVAHVSLVLVCTQSLQAAVYNNLPIFAFGVRNSTMNLKIEKDILVPSLTRYKVNDSDLYSILPFSGSEQSIKIGQEILSRRGITLGNAMLYIYIAINNAFDRIYNNLIVKSRPEEDSVREELGFKGNTDADGFMNIRDVLAIKEIKDATLNVEVYSTRTVLRNAQKNLRFVSDGAFWDPDTHRIGLYLDPALFYWLPGQVNWGNQTTSEAVLAVRNYVSRQFIQIIGHELVHFIQYAGGTKIYNNPFFAEASATFLEENIALREDVYQVTTGMTDRGLSLKMPLENTPCGALFKLNPPVSCLAMTKLESSIKTNKPGQVDLEGMIAMDEKAFYGRDSAALLKLYNTSLAFTLFAGTLPREKFQAYFGTVLKTGQGSRRALAGLNKEFDKWAIDFTKEWWSDSSNSSLFEEVKRATTVCLENRSYLTAFSGASILITMRQNDPECWMYMADVFWNLDIPFFAFDYYARAFAVGNKHGYHNTSRLMIESRIGDGYEALGNLSTALDWYNRFLDGDHQPLGHIDLIVSLRSSLKRSFYQQVIKKHQKQSQGAFYLLNSYINILQLRGCPTDEEKANQTRLQEALQRKDWEAFDRLYKANFLEIRNRMLADIANTNDFEEVYRRNQQRCSP